MIVALDAEAYALAATGKAHPRVLFFPTGSQDSEVHAAEATAAFLALGAEAVDVLRLIAANPTRRAVDQAFEAADLVFFGGGSAPLIVKHGDRHGLRPRLEGAQRRGTVLAGTSGGAIALFEGGLGAYNGYRPLPGWGLAPGYLLPHYRPGEEANLGPWFAAHPGADLYGLEDSGILVWDGQPSSVPGTGGVFRLGPGFVKSL